jgi:fatty acid desaturase
VPRAQPVPEEDVMTKNESSIDRIIRVVIAVVALVAAIAVGFPSVGAWILLVVAVIMGVTAAVGFCPLYRLFGMSTCKVQSGS